MNIKIKILSFSWGTGRVILRVPVMVRSIWKGKISMRFGRTGTEGWSGLSKSWRDLFKPDIPSEVGTGPWDWAMAYWAVWPCKSEASWGTKVKLIIHGPKDGFKMVFSSGRCSLANWFLMRARRALSTQVFSSWPNNPQNWQILPNFS